MGFRIKRNAWDNWNGYEGNRKVKEFGLDESAAKEWLEARQRETKIPIDQHNPLPYSPNTMSEPKPMWHFEVQMKVTGWNGAQGPESETMEVSKTYTGIDVDPETYPDELSAVEEAINQAWMCLTLDFPRANFKKGWKYKLESGMIRHKASEAWFTPEKGLECKEEFIGGAK